MLDSSCVIICLRTGNGFFLGTQNGKINNNFGPIFIERSTHSLPKQLSQNWCGPVCITRNLRRKWCSGNPFSLSQTPNFGSTASKWDQPVAVNPSSSDSVITMNRLRRRVLGTIDSVEELEAESAWVKLNLRTPSDGDPIGSSLHLCLLQILFHGVQKCRINATGIFYHVLL